MKVYFSDVNGKNRFLATCKTDKQAMKIINEFCDERCYKIPYVRFWEDTVDGKDRTWCDVGSWTELFFIERG